nr:histidine protein methyltransferase 1 homolog [Tanacetum cinerariifolium]
MTFEEAIGRLKTYEERIKYKGKQVDNQDRLLFTRYEEQGRRRGHGGSNQSQGQENNFKKETHNNSNKLTHNKSKVMCSKCKEYGPFANRCPLKKEEQSNLIKEDLEPQLLMAIIEESPFNLDLTDIKQQGVNSESLDGGITESMNQPGIKEDIHRKNFKLEGGKNQKYDQPGLKEDHNNKGRLTQSMSIASDKEMQLPSPAVKIMPSKGRISVSDITGSELMISSKTDASLKSMDNSLDLVNFLKHEIQDLQLSFRDKRVLEMIMARDGVWDAMSAEAAKVAVVDCHKI